MLAVTPSAGAFNQFLRATYDRPAVPVAVQQGRPPDARELIAMARPTGDASPDSAYEVGYVV